MKAETVFNVANHLTDGELKELYKLIAVKLKMKTTVNKQTIKTPLTSPEEIIKRLIKNCFSKV